MAITGFGFLINLKNLYQKYHIQVTVMNGSANC
jgi:hypothetical protein